ncbi:sugar ABC transporter ATP-binding protein [Jatrophihabitans fulvus]
MSSDLTPGGDTRPASGGTTRPALDARALTKTFTGVVALDHVDLTIAPGEVHALLGENGSGKSTFIKILSGYHDPDAGSEVLIDGAPMSLGSPDSAYALGCRFVHQDLGLIDSSSIIDNLCLNTGFPTRFGTVSRRAARKQARADLARVGLEGVDPEQLVATLTPAMKTGVAVARALRDDRGDSVKLLVLDEPTATLPDNEVQHLLQIVKQVARSGVGVLYVTHRLDEVFQVADRVTVLRDGHWVATEPSSALDRKHLVNLLIGSELEEIAAAVDRLHAPNTNEPVLEVRDLHAVPLQGVSFTVAPGDVLGIAGITGSGRETLLGALFGAGPRDSGSVVVNGTPIKAKRPDLSMSNGMAYLPPDRKLLGGIMAFSARENLSLSDLKPFWRGGILRRGAERTETRSWFKRLDVRPGGAVDQRLMAFSGGNQQKVLFGKWLRRTPLVFLLDEPTQGVDIGAKGELHKQLLEAADNGAGIVVSSSDVDELAALCRRVLVLRDGHIVTELTGARLTVANIARECLGAEREVVAK